MTMTRNEEKASLIKSISNLHARIECGRSEGCRMWDEELSLKHLEKKLDEFKGGATHTRKPSYQF